jgi:hypothetical protein
MRSATDVAWWRAVPELAICRLPARGSRAQGSGEQEPLSPSRTAVDQVQVNLRRAWRLATWPRVIRRTMPVMAARRMGASGWRLVRHLQLT